jgi:hypothetical protein
MGDELENSGSDSPLFVQSQGNGYGPHVPDMIWTHNSDSSDEAKLSTTDVFPAVEEALDDDDDDDRLIPPYDATQEDMPQCLTSHKSFKEIVVAGKDRMIRLLRDPIENNPYRDGNVEGLIAEIKKRTVMRENEQVRVGFIGDMATWRLARVLCSTLFWVWENSLARYIVVGDTRNYRTEH